MLTLQPSLLRLGDRPLPRSPLAMARDDEREEREGRDRDRKEKKAEHQLKSLHLIGQVECNSCSHG